MRKISSFLAAIAMAAFTGYAQSSDTGIFFVDGNFNNISLAAKSNNRVEPVWMEYGSYHCDYRPFTFDPAMNPFVLKAQNEAHEYYVYLNDVEKPNSNRGLMANMYDVEFTVAHGDVFKLYDHAPFFSTVSFVLAPDSDLSQAEAAMLVKVVKDEIQPVDMASTPKMEALEGTKYQISAAPGGSIAKVMCSGAEVLPVDGVYTVSVNTPDAMDVVIDVASTCLLFPAVTLRSNIFSTYGEESQYTLALGSTVPGRIAVDFGSGLVDYEIAPAYDLNASTFITCPATRDGVVNIYTYGDVLIDYFNADGCDITDIAFHRPQAIEVLSLRHNSLHALDLSDMTALASADLGDNPYDRAPLIIGPDKPHLMILNVDEIERFDPSFCLSDYPAMASFDAYDNTGLLECDPSGCPNLMKLSIDETPVAALDVTHNPELLILNVAGTRIPSIDVSKCTKLQQLFCSAMGSEEQSERMTYLDVSACPDLVYLFAANNALTDIDLSHNPLLRDISLGRNYLTSLDLSENTELINVSIDHNYLTFATLPFDQGWLSYYYPQYPIEVPESYLVGSPIDLSYDLMREGTETTAQLFVVDTDDPMGERALPPSTYTFADGVLTIHEVISGRVFARFYNSVFSDYPLQTSQFKVKSADEYGKYEYAFSMSLPEVGLDDVVALSLGIEGASQARPRHFYVDLGDDAIIEGLAYSADMPDEPNFVHVKGVKGDVTVYVEADASLTSLGVADMVIGDIKLDKLHDLRNLSLTSTGMSSIDLRMNTALCSLTLTGNDFGDRLSLLGENDLFNKNHLTHIDLSNNGITRLPLVQPDAFEYLDLSHNLLEDINLTDGERISYLDLSHNRFEYLRLSYQSSLKYFCGSHNSLAEIVMPETIVLESFDVSYNDFTFSSLPVLAADGIDYVYAPQSVIVIPEKAMNCDLSALYCTVAGHTTAFRWVDAEGVMLSEGVDYTIEAGVTRFLDPALGRTVHCEMSNAAFPDLVISTTPMVAAGMPKYVVAEFTTPVGGQNVSITLGGAYDGASTFIDWTGDGTPTEYLLKTTYTVFSGAKTVAGARVRVLSYDPVSPVTIFSISGVSMSDVDLAGLTSLKCLSISNAGIDDLIMPESDDLTELYLINNKFTDFDFAAYPSVTALSFEGNLLTDADISGMPRLEMINFSNNSLKSISLGSHPGLWAVHLTNNKLTEIDLSSLPALYQVTLDHNLLTSVCLEGLPDLHVVYLDHNCLDFNTLPLPRSQWTVYHYASQQPLAVEAVRGVVDLSSQLNVHGVESQYLWLDGEPWVDESTGELMGYTLAEGVDYTIAAGVTTFLKDVPAAVCVITNELFPRTYMTTPALDIKVAGLASAVVSAPVVWTDGGSVHVSADPGCEVCIYAPSGVLVAAGVCDASGSLSVSGIPAGAYIVKAGAVAAKVLVK